MAWHHLTWQREQRERRDALADRAIAAQGKGEYIAEKLEALTDALDF
jgi:hypothetical protein